MKYRSGFSVVRPTHGGGRGSRQTVITISPEIIDDLFWWQVRFDFSWELVAAVKEIPGRSYDAGRRVWLIPGLPESEDGLSKFLQEAQAGRTQAD